MNILITSASRKIWLVRAFQQALLQAGGGEVISVDSSSLAPALYFSDQHYLVPQDNDPAFLPLILKLCEKLKVKVLIPTRDEELPLFAKNKNKFKDIGTVIMVSELATVKICQNKKLFIKFCHEKGFLVPDNYSSSRLPEKIIFPLFVKAPRSKGGRQAFRINTKAELDLILKQMPEVIIQEFVEYPEYTIDIFADFNGEVITVVPRERLNIFGGESFAGKTSKNSALINGGVDLARKLKLVGHNTIQCFLCGNAVKFIEVNPRFGGAACLGFEAGAFTPLLLIKLISGEKLKPQIGKFKANRIMLRYTDDFFINAGALTKNKFI